MLMFGIVAVPVEWFCFHSFQKKKARGIAKKVVGLFLRAAPFTQTANERPESL
jgi:hypothetical protein